LVLGHSDDLNTLFFSGLERICIHMRTRFVLKCKEDRGRWGNYTEELVNVSYSQHSVGAMKLMRIRWVEP
jgi:hypothetical protein